MLLLQIIIFFLPLYLARFSIFGFKTNILDIILGLFVLWQLTKGDWQKIKYNTKKFLLPIALLAVGAIVATANSSDILRSHGILKSYFVLPILFFFATASVIETNEQKEGILRAWFSSGFIVALIGLFYWLAGDLTYDGRLRAFFESPNQLAMFLAPAFIIATYIAQSQRSKVKSQNYNSKFKIIDIAYIIVMLSIGVVIFLTKSFGTIAAISISLICFFIFRHYFASLYLSASMRTKIQIGILMIFLFSNFYFLFSAKDFSERSSLSSRVVIWQSSGAILKGNWIWGIGPGAFQEKYLEYQKYFPPYLEWASPQPHNIFLAFWLQTGIIGLAGFLWLIFIFFKNVWQNKKDSVVFLSGILMIYTLAHGLIDTTYWKNDLAIMFWLVILLSLSLAPIKSLPRQD